jgi:ATP-binding protein involved in chromosome partitioning
MCFDPKAQMMTEPTLETITAALQAVIDPLTGKNVVETGAIEGLSVRDGHVTFAVEVAPDRGARAEPLREACEKAAAAVPGVAAVTAVLTAHRETEVPRSPHAAPEHRRIPPPAMLPGVAAVIAVASGKGGVGKSTVAVNLALGLAGEGLKVGILDADIYGPSIPKLLAIDEEPGEEDGKVKPVEKFGIKAMSIGFLIDEGTPMIWRGPMVQNALTQMLRDVAWAPLDVLIVDMPPGTGDAQLAIVQTVPLKGAVIVSTPQDLALIDARRAMAMFRTTKVPVLGLIENMSVFVCPHCGKESPIFGHGGARKAAKESGIAFLGEVPLVLAIRETSDGGTPIVATQPDGPEAKAFRLIAKAVAEKIKGVSRSAPKIVYE